MATEIFDTPGPGVWQCPVGVTSVIVECWGEGGAGGSSESGGGGGGGGGAYAKKTISVTPGNNYNYNVGTPGNLEGSWFVDATTIFADFGTDGLDTSGGVPGTDSDSIGTVRLSGGNGGSVNPGGGGAGGGSSAGSSSVGNAGQNSSGASGGAGGAAVTDGGAGGNGGDSGLNGSDGIQPGGGGGGSGFGGIAGNGAAGRVKLTYTLPTTPVFRFGIFEGAVFAAR